MLSNFAEWYWVVICTMDVVKEAYMRWSVARTDQWPLDKYYVGLFLHEHGECIFLKTYPSMATVSCISCIILERGKQQ